MFILNPQSGVPIYRQILEQVRRMVASGQLPPGTALPSVRDLALRHTILEARPLRKRPDTGMVRARWELFNQDGDKVLEMDGYGFFGRRHPATPQELAGLDAQRGAS